MFAVAPQRRAASRIRTGSRWSKSIHVCRYTMAAMAPPRLARGPLPCKGSVLILDHGAKKTRRAWGETRQPDARRRRRTSIRLLRQEPRPEGVAGVDSQGFGPQPSLCKSDVLPGYTTSPRRPAQGSNLLGPEGPPG